MAECGGLRPIRTPARAKELGARRHFEPAGGVGGAPDHFHGLEPLRLVGPERFSVELVLDGGPNDAAAADAGLD